MGDEQGDAEAGNENGDVPVDGTVGIEAHLAQGFDEQEAAAGCQARNLRFNGGITGGEGRDRAVLTDADDVIALGHRPIGGKTARIFNIREHITESAAVLRVQVH